MRSVLASGDELSPARVFGRPGLEDIWIGPTQERALAALWRDAGSATKLLLGPRASGKSTLLARYLEERDRTRYFRATGSWESAIDFLSALVESTDLTPTGSSDVDLRNLFTAFLDKQASEGLKIVLAIDDAQRLPGDVWRELDQLRALRLQDGSALELILAGRPDTYGMVQSRKAAGWKSVNVSVTSLTPPSPTDIAAYVKNRLETAGLPRSLFTSSACQTVAKLSGGSFTSVNLLCQMAMLLSRETAANTVDEYVIRQARINLTKGQLRHQRGPAAASPTKAQRPSAALSRRPLAN